MSIFVVHYGYVEDSQAIATIRPAHRAWLNELLERGALLASGPMANSPKALLIFSADSEAELSQLLNEDPFDLAGLIAARTIEEWNPVFGPFVG